MAYMSEAVIEGEGRKLAVGSGTKERRIKRDKLAGAKLKMKRGINRRGKVRG
jgi:hypothetical protein